MCSRTVQMRYPDRWFTGVWQLLSTFGKQNNILPPERAVGHYFTKQFFSLVTCIIISMVKCIDAQVEAKVNDALHFNFVMFSIIFPAPESIDCGRHFRTGIT